MDYVDRSEASSAPVRILARVVRSAGLLAFLLLFEVGSVSGQAPADTAAVLLTAWRQAVGTAPLDHPAGATDRLCLDRGLPEGGIAFPDLSSAVRETLVRGLREAYSFELTTGCEVDWSQPGFGGWVVDRRERPAVLVSLSELEFGGANEARVGLHVLTGSSWAVGRRCTLVREQERGPWNLLGCTSFHEGV